MNSDLPKVAHEVAGKAMVRWVVQAVRDAGADRIVLVVGYGADTVESVFADDDADIDFVIQADQLGTGHAAACCSDALETFDGDVLVLAGDGPLIRPTTISTMLDRHRQSGAVATLATSTIDDPTGYGRILRDGNDRFVAIVEEKNCSDEQRAIREVYPSYACFDAVTLFAALGRLDRDPVSDEYYLTDIPAMLSSEGGRIEVVDAVPPQDILSINTPQQLADVGKILRQREGALS
jgi:bifunctional UDP-N-acetylglucosamine pyrophosphorylase/glucosamine-1-phosphate N-acetyltransferase